MRLREVRQPAAAVAPRLEAAAGGGEEEDRAPGVDPPPVNPRSKSKSEGGGGTAYGSTASRKSVAMHRNFQTSRFAVITFSSVLQFEMRRNPRVCRALPIVLGYPGQLAKRAGGRSKLVLNT